MKSFIFPFFEIVLGLLKRLSCFSILRSIFNRHKWTKSSAFVDAWVSFWFFLSFAVLYTYNLTWELFQWFVVALAILRVLELVVYSLSVLLVDPFTKGDYALSSYRRSLILSLMNYVEIMTWFAVIYHHFSSCFKDESLVLKSATGSLYYSLVTMSTLGYGEIVPLNDGARGVIVVQTLIGVFLIVLIVSRIISYLPTPQTSDINEKNREAN